MAQDYTFGIDRSLYSLGQVRAREHGPGQVRCHVLARSQKSEVRDQKSEVWLSCPAMLFEWASVRALISILPLCIGCGGGRWVTGRGFAPPPGKANSPTIGLSWVILSVKRDAWCAATHW